ncbi:hypothetical protein TNCV_4979161 [Trichonephila clavipes]|nr:hypothetical protein TNCV_4979161 [Trichonephila clavipes]
MTRKSLNIKENNHQIFGAKCECAESQGPLQTRHEEYRGGNPRERDGYTDKGERTQPHNTEATRIQNKFQQFKSIFHDNKTACGIRVDRIFFFFKNSKPTYVIYK